MPDSPQPSDDELAGWLAAAARRFDPVPEDVLAAARGSFAWRAVDAELAGLAYDSLVDEDQLPAVVRGANRSRMLSFQAPDLTVEVEVDESGTRTVTGQLVPAQPAHVELRHPGGVIAVRADDLGRFRATGVPAGPVSLLCRSARDPITLVETDWVVL